MGDLIVLVLIALALIVLITYARFFMIVAIALFCLYILAHTPEKKSKAITKPAPQTQQWNGENEK